MTVSDLLLKILADFGVTHLFGIPGDAINDVTEAVRKQDAVKFIQVRHEEAGAFAASAQAKLTGDLSVCMGTAGPGAVHLLNGLYDAKMDHAPVLAVTGHVDTTYIGTDYHQEIDLDNLFSDVAVFSHVVTNESQLPHIIVQACQKAISYQSVAHISIPLDIAGKRVSARQDAYPVITRFGSSVPAEEHLDEAAELIDGADKVAILAGIGCRDAREELLAFAEKVNAPIVRSLRAKDILPDLHPLCVGGLGNLGGQPGVKAVEECDVLMLIGTDFPYHEYFPEQAKAIQIDTEPTRLGKRCAVEVGLRGHAKPTLEALTRRVAQKQDKTFLEGVQHSMQAWLREQAGDEQSDKMPLLPQRLAHAVSEQAADDAVFVCDTGTVTAWTARHTRMRGQQRYILSSSLASMAFGLSGAIGAQLKYPDRQVIALCGDGGFTMLMADFLTAVKYRLPITVVIFNNAKLGLIQMEQEASGLPEYQVELHNPDFAAFAEACGGRGVSIDNPGQLDAALREAYQSPEPWVVDVHVKPDELVIPPKISPKQAFRYTVAKIKEFSGAR